MDKSLEVFYSLYRDSCEQEKTAEEKRNKCFICLCILEAVSFILVRNPDLVYILLNGKINKELGTTILVSNSIIQTLLWVLIIYFLIRYVQAMLFVERQYKYLSGLEQKISDLSGEEWFFKREGENYQKDYPIVLNLIALFYKLFCPILFSAINILHIIKEWRLGDSKLPLLIDAFLCASAFAITWFYFFEIHEKLTAWCKKNIPGIKWLSEKIHKLLKEV